MQKNKLRPIDDYKENQVNSAYSSMEQASLCAMGHLVWAVATLQRLYRAGGEFEFALSTGERLAGFVHEDFQGRCAGQSRRTSSFL